MAEWAACASCFQVFLAPKSDGDNADTGPVEYCPHSGFSNLQSYTDTNLPKLCWRKRHYIYYSVRKEICLYVPRLSARQISMKRVQDKGITRHVKNEMENCSSTKYFNRTSLFTIWYLRIPLLKCMCNPKINTCHTFTCRPGQSGKKLSGLTLRFPAKAKQGDSRPSCFSSYTVNKCLFCCILSVMFFAFLCTFFSNFAI